MKPLSSFSTGSASSSASAHHLAASTASPSRTSSNPLAPSTSSTASPLVSSTTPPASEDPSPTDLLLATPPVLVKLFALAAPVVHLAAVACQLVTWQHPNFFASLLVLLAWWAVCLFGTVLARYGFNSLVLAYILWAYFARASRHAASSASASSASAAAAASSQQYRHARPPTLTPAAYSQLLVSAHFLFAHLHQFRLSVLHPLSQRFSFTPTRPSTPAPAYATARFVLTSYPAYLVVTYLVPLRYLFLLTGSVAILWNAPFFKTLRTLLWRSAAVRWTCRIVLSLLNGGHGFRDEWNKTKRGVGFPGLLGKKQYGSSKTAARDAKGEEKVVKTTRRVSSVVPTLAASSTVAPAGGDPSPSISEDAVNSRSMQTSASRRGEEAAVEEEDEEEDVEVQFTVFENQRWWVGLDWTHALLPGERASWTDPSSHPSNPPSSFHLPASQTTYIPSPLPNDPTSRLKKTTSWRWLDPEWKVLREPVASVALPVSSPGGVLAAGTSGGSDGGINGDDPATSTTGAGATLPSPGAHGAAASTSSPSSPVAASSSIFSSSPPKLPSFMTSSPTLSSLTSAAISPSPVATSYLSPTALVQDSHSTLFANWSVDAEGWQYGDNHFEKMGPKGGLGKYTRRRAWVRRAGLVERVERVSGTGSGSSAGGGAGETLRAPATRTAGGGAGGRGGGEERGRETDKKERRRSSTRGTPATGASRGADTTTGRGSETRTTGSTETTALLGGGGAGGSTKASSPDKVLRRRSAVGGESKEVD
ncbi:hypothetical protein JCM10212_003803 [Sporobolomyces blumeae]